MTTTWILIIVLIGGGGSTAITSIDGYFTENACMTAGNDLTKKIEERNTWAGIQRVIVTCSKNKD